MDGEVDFGGDLGGYGGTVEGGNLAGAPDIGTIGGTLADAYGETSATLGGETTGAQGFANDLAGMLGAFGSAGLVGQGMADIPGLTPADVGSFGPVASVTAGQSSGWDNVLGIFDRILQNPVARTALLAAVPALAIPANIYGMARASQSPKGAASAWGGSVGSQIGQAVLGPAGGVLGGLAGQYAGSKSGGLPGYTGERAAQEPGGGTGMNLEGILGGLGQLYQAGRAGRESGQVAGTLRDLYGQTSPYAQTLRQQLERKDAAAGRRSQYGPREVELQARLAQLYSQNTPRTMAAQEAARAARNRMFGAGLGLAKETGLLDYGQRALRNLWETPTDMTGFRTPLEMPSYSDYAAQAYPPSSFGEMGTGTYGGNDFFLNY